MSDCIAYNSGYLTSTRAIKEGKSSIEGRKVRADLIDVVGDVRQVISSELVRPTLNTSLEHAQESHQPLRAALFLQVSTLH